MWLRWIKSAVFAGCIFIILLSMNIIFVVPGSQGQANFLFVDSSFLSQINILQQGQSSSPIDLWVEQKASPLPQMQKMQRP